ncbi:bifunctional 2',3'-cyclic-nucleotide 2'-phosphodiesterase/3'-nucleotidase [Roseovarius sp.]|uniref:bifunctional 2',3'-cyclic-nucleotide 2'-phosphodiesterase/3'-nucleotidase n=1 Tax=Roseovarius sp. TaxID=1486281 RepID=UPI003B5B7597
MPSDLIWPHETSASAGEPNQPHVWLRLLETTDVHGHLMPYDYTRDTDTPGYGLARTATLVARARTEARNSLLFDNGDFLQGSVLSDIVAAPDSGWTGPHPVIDAMNHMGYDAAALGNHEFNFGLDWLTRTLKDARFPVLCANARLSDPDATPLRPPSVLLRREIRDSAGRTHTLRLGVLGLLPPQVTTWDHVHLQGRLVTRGIVETAMSEVPRLRAAGADIVVALVHSGIGPAVRRPEEAQADQEHAALALATVPGIDALLCGHSHQVFPDPSAETATAGVDHRAGTFAGVPAVMAGFRGSHLGVIDLCLVARDGGRWHVGAAHSRARPVRPGFHAAPVPPESGLVDRVRAAHRAALTHAARPLGHAARPLHSYLSVLRPGDTLRPVLDAKAAALRAALADTPHAHLPVLATSACFKTGGHGGPDHFIDIPPGPLTLGHAAELYPFPNTLVGLRLTGAEVADWLERAASCFQQVHPGLGDRPQPLWNPAFAGHSLDTVSELTYRIDLSQPPRYDPMGRLLNPEATRIRDLRHHGTPVAADAVFAMATNNFRAFGGGPFPKAGTDRIIHETRRKVRDYLVDRLRDTGVRDPAAPAYGWWLDGPRDATVLLATGPGIRAHPEEIAALSARDLGLCAQGFVQLAFPMTALAHLANPAATS